MPRFINNDCIACGACEPECPQNAISSGDIYVVDQSLCNDCPNNGDKSKCEESCPVDCIEKV